MISLGFDFGSLYAKAVLLDSTGQVEESLYRRRGPGEAEALAVFLVALEARHPGLRAAVGTTGGEAPGVPGPHRHPGQRPARRGRGGPAPAPGGAQRHRGGRPDRQIHRAGGGRRPARLRHQRSRAAGTGAFLEQQARRLGLGAEDLSRLAAQAKRAATIAGRCSVFAASDMIHLQQKGTPLAEIAYGLCAAIARNFLSTLLKGREAPAPVVLAGGCARNGGILRAFGECLGRAAAPSRWPGLEGAVGAALGADPAGAVPIGEILARLAAPCAAAGAERRGYPPLRPAQSRPSAEEPESGCAGGAAGYLGIDVGSASTDLVLLDRAGAVLSSIYLATRGRPAEVLLEGLAILDARYGGRLRVLGVGATGSGRHLAGKLVAQMWRRTRSPASCWGRATSFPMWTPSWRSAGRIPSSSGPGTGP